MAKIKSITTVEISETHIKVLQAALSGRGPAVSFCATADIARLSDEEIAKQLSKTGNTRFRLKSNLIVGIIPRQSALFRYLTLPSHDERELRSMVDLQIISHIPYSREDVVVDFLILEKQVSVK